jgi:phosphatidylinositol alpha-1,6-mannosyltransferase
MDARIEVGLPPASPFPHPEPITGYDGPPLLAVVVDAEEEFEWADPLAPQPRGTVSIRSQRAAHELFSHYAIKPTYLVTYPLASEPVPIGVLREFLAEGLCDIGAQLHPWVTPPLTTAQSETHSYAGNLPIDLEREKLRRLVDAIETAYGRRPTAYKAGRYGFGPNTSSLLEAEGFEVDTSLIPRSSYRRSGGMDFTSFDYQPFWFGNQRRLLELPITRALTGLLSRRWPGLHRLAESRPLQSLHAGGLLARAGLLERITLSPEGSDLQAMCRLTRTLLARGTRIFTVTYHSPSLEPGHTPYVRNERDLAMFFDQLSGFFSFFRDEIGGRFDTIAGLRETLLTHKPPPPVPAAPARPASSPGRRCLVVANTFPPVHGGSAVVYHSLARFGHGRVSVLAPQEDYRFGQPIRLWREFDRVAPYHVHRIPRLRNPLLQDDPGLLHRVRAAAQDLRVRIDLLRAIRRIARTERIDVLCIGELVANGWLAPVCRRLFGLPSITYVHGEEVSSRMSYDLDGGRRRRILAVADAIVAVSRFTQQTLVTTMGVPPEKIALISNGVDLTRFTRRPRRADLVARYGLAGRRVLLTVGRLYARKGMDRVIESLPAVLRELPDVCYLMVGDGTYRPTLEALAARLGVQDSVIFAGAVADAELIDHYALADVFIMANREMPDGDTEGFGLVFLEANACGIPVIAGRAGGSVDAVTDGVNGLVVDGDRSEEIAAAIIRMFQNDALRQQLVETGTEVAIESSWERRVEQFLALCDRLADAA